MSRPTTALGWHAVAAMSVLEAQEWFTMYWSGPFAGVRNPHDDQYIQDHVRICLERAAYATFQAETIELETGVDVFPGVF